jgi:hypothetical protein
MGGVRYLQRFKYWCEWWWDRGEITELGGFTQCNIEAVVVETIAEIVNEVTLNGINTIIYGSLKFSLSGSCEISLQSGGTGIQDTNPIGVTCPCLTECFFKVFWGFFKGFSERLAGYGHCVELLVSNISVQHWLYYILAVKAVHADHSDISNLLVGNLASALIQLFSAVESEVQSRHEVIKAVQLVFDLLYQLWKVFPLHLSAIVMEIEPHILDKLIFNFVDDAGELRADTKLRPFLVD